MNVSAFTMRLLSAAFVAVVVAVGTAWVVSDSHADVPVRETVATALYERDYVSIAELSDVPGSLVVRGRVSGDAQTILIGRGIPFSESTVSVAEIIAGAARDNSGTVIVRQTGGPDADGTVLRLEGEELLSSGDEVLLFLKWDQEIDRYWIAGGSHGHLRVSNGTVSHANFRLTDSDPHPLALAVDGRTETDLAELVVRRG